MRCRSNHSRQGAVVIEAAVLLPLLIIVTFVAIDISQYINTGQQITNASREAAQLASQTTTTSTEEIQQACIAYFASTIPYLSREEIEAATTVTVQRVISNSNTDEDLRFSDINGTQLDAVPSGDALAVVVDFDYEAVRWISGPAYPMQSIRTVCRRE